MGQGSIGRFTPGSELARERKGCESVLSLHLAEADEFCITSIDNKEIDRDAQIGVTLSYLSMMSALSFAACANKAFSSAVIEAPNTFSTFNAFVICMPKQYFYRLRSLIHKCSITASSAIYHLKGL